MSSVLKPEVVNATPTQELQLSFEWVLRSISTVSTIFFSGVLKVSER